MAGAAPFKPLSPNIWQWRWHVTMFASILHRGTGVVLYLAAIGIVVWLSALAAGPETYRSLMSLVPAWAIGLKLSVLAGVTTYHLLNGVRHLVWDAGAGFAPKTASFTAWLVIVISFVAFAVPAAFVAQQFL